MGKYKARYGQMQGTVGANTRTKEKVVINARVCVRLKVRVWVKVDPPPLLPPGQSLL